MLFTAPAAGYRSRETGALGGVGSEGNVWSSSSYAAGNINAGRLNFNAGNVNPLNTGNRANAYSVRCVQHLQELSGVPGFPTGNSGTLVFAACMRRWERGADSTLAGMLRRQGAADANTSESAILRFFRISDFVEDAFARQKPT